MSLAYLYAVGDRRRKRFDREPYHQFWQLATQRSEARTGVNGHVAGSERSTALRMNVNGIARAAGMDVAPEVMARLSNITDRRQLNDD